MEERRIDDLPLGTPSRDVIIPVMIGGLSVRVTAGQLLDLIVGSAPGALDTLDELAAALGDDANFAATVTNALALKAALASPAFTGTPTAPTAASGTNTTQLATTAFANDAAKINALAAKTTPVDADEFRLADSAASFGFKKLSFGNLWTWIKSKISGEIVTPWVELPSASIISALQGFGTATGVTFRSRRNGGSLEILGRFASGTSTAVEARVPIGFNGTVGNVAVSSFMNSAVFVVGTGGLNITAASAYLMLATGGNTYLRIGLQGSGREGLTPVVGNVALPASGNSIAFFASVPIEGWS